MQISQWVSLEIIKNVDIRKRVKALETIIRLAKVNFYCFIVIKITKPKLLLLLEML